MKLAWLLTTAWLLWCACAVAAESQAVPEDEKDRPEWVLKFRDDFERTELGDDWSSNDATIRHGRMLLGRDRPACAKIARAFPADVRIELTAEAYEGRPPCDLSVTLAAERFQPMSFNYLLAFGGVNNTVNKLTGGRRLQGTYDKNPRRLIEPGRTYRLIATKEGKRLTLLVDGELLLEGTDDQIMGGPGFDAVGLVTWNGMYVDNVRVYERIRPHADTPRYLTGLPGLVLSLDRQGKMAGPDTASPTARAAIAAYNRGDLPAAQQLFEKAEGELRAAGLAYVYGNLNHDERPEDFPRLARLFAELAAAHPDDARLADYARAAGWFGQVRIFPRSHQQCSLLMALGPKGNPFYDKAKWYRARFLRANAQEGANRELLATAAAMFRELHQKAPDNVLLQELTGRRVPWGEELIERDADVPRWAALLGEMYARQLAIMDWWFTKRQLPDGQLGGGWGDDVELLRSWGPFAMISDADPAVRDGIERLCQGVWDHVLVDGFAADVGDVEHSAEPSADTLPTMVAIRYGDPLWYERNLASCRRIRDCYTGIDQNGFVRFKSGYFGGGQASNSLRHGGDTYYSTRPMKHFLWAAWYGDEEARRFYVHWARGWVEATMAAKYTKPAGVPPGTIWFPSGDIAPPNGAAWNDPTYNIYGSGWIGNFWIQDAFLAGHYLSGDPFFLQPLHAWMRFYQAEIPENTAQEPDVSKDPLGWTARKGKDLWNCDSTLAEYRWITGDASYDELLGLKRSDARLHLPGDFDALLKRLEGALSSLRVNFNLATREVLQTDRAGLPGTETAFAAMTGAVRRFNDAGIATMAVTWEVPHRDFAPLVVYASREHLRVWIYNLAPQPTRVGLRLWQLLPGEYEVNCGLLGSGEGYRRRCRWQSPEEFTLRHRADVYHVDVPSRKELAVDFRLIRRTDRQSPLPDPAVADRDLVVAKTADGRAALKLTVHNLGNVPVKDLAVALVHTAGGQPREIARQTINLLPACKDLQPGKAVVSFPDVQPVPGLAAVIDPEATVTEVYELNNRATWSK